MFGSKYNNYFIFMVRRDDISIYNPTDDTLDDDRACTETSAKDFMVKLIKPTENNIIHTLIVCWNIFW